MDEAQAIARARTGSTDAFGEIIEHYQVPIVRYLYRLTGQHDVAEDLAQDTFLQAYRSILKTRSELAFKPWLYRIATNNAFQYHRRRRLLSFLPFTGSEEWVPEQADAGTDRIDERMAIEEALVKVPQERRACMVLHFVEGLKYREIADIVGVSEEAVRKRVARGSQEFRRAYGAARGGDGG